MCKLCNEVIYDNYSINNPNLNDIDKIINNYVTSYNKNLIYIPSNVISI